MTDYVGQRFKHDISKFKRGILVENYINPFAIYFFVIIFVVDDLDNSHAEIFSVVIGFGLPD